VTVRVALHTGLAPGAEEAHREIPAELLERVHTDADAGLVVVWEL
jgi:hypothetical protein